MTDPSLMQTPARAQSPIEPRTVLAAIGLRQGYTSSAADADSMSVADTLALIESRGVTYAELQVLVLAMGDRLNPPYR